MKNAKRVLTGLSVLLVFGCASGGPTLKQYYAECTAEGGTHQYCMDQATNICLNSGCVWGE